MEAPRVEARPHEPCVGIVYDERMLLHEVAGAKASSQDRSDGGGAASPDGDADSLQEDEDAMSVDSDFPHGHPECPQRITSIYDAIQKAGLMSRCRLIEADMISYADIGRVHNDEYIQYMQENDGKDRDTLQEALEDNKCTFGTEFHDHRPEDWNGGSVYMNEHTVKAARVAAGGVLRLVQEVCDPYSSVKNGFAIVRPPGHHAEPGCCMGFSIFNSVAIAAKMAREEYGCKRVLIVDWDVHHGNGTQHMFLEDNTVLYFSTHRFDNGDFYPCGTEGCVECVGEGRGEGYNINVPWNLGIEYVYDEDINYVEGDPENMKKSKAVDPSSLLLSDAAALAAAAEEGPLFASTGGVRPQPDSTSVPVASGASGTAELPAGAGDDNDDSDSSTDGVDHFDTVGDSDYNYVWDQVLLPVARRFCPDLILVSAGFDAARGDPLGGADVTPGGYRNLLAKLMPLAKRERVVLVLEGGYHLEAISASAVACVKELISHLESEDEMMSTDPPARKRMHTPRESTASAAAVPAPSKKIAEEEAMEIRAVRDHAKKTVRSVIEALQPYWPCLEQDSSLLAGSDAGPVPSRLPVPSQFQDADPTSSGCGPSSSGAALPSHPNVSPGSDGGNPVRPPNIAGLPGTGAGANGGDGSGNGAFFRTLSDASTGAPTSGNRARADSDLELFGSFGVGSPPKIGSRTHSLDSPQLMSELTVESIEADISSTTGQSPRSQAQTRSSVFSGAMGSPASADALRNAAAAADTSTRMGHGLDDLHLDPLSAPGNHHGSQLDPLRASNSDAVDALDLSTEEHGLLSLSLDDINAGPISGDSAPLLSTPTDQDIGNGPS